MCDHSYFTGSHQLSLLCSTVFCHLSLRLQRSSTWSQLSYTLQTSCDTHIAQVYVNIQNNLGKPVTVTTDHKDLRSSNSVFLMRKKSTKHSGRNLLAVTDWWLTSCVVTNISDSRSHQLLLINLNSMKLVCCRVLCAVCMVNIFVVARTPTEWYVFFLAGVSLSQLNFNPDHTNHFIHFAKVFDFNVW